MRARRKLNVSGGGIFTEETILHSWTEWKGWPYGNAIRRLVCRYDGFRGDAKFAKWHAALMAFVRKRKRAFSSGYSLAALIFLQRVPTRASPTPPAMQKTRWKFNSRETMHGEEEFIASLIPRNFSRGSFIKISLSFFSFFFSIESCKKSRVTEIRFYVI